MIIRIQQKYISNDEKKTRFELNSECNGVLNLFAETINLKIK